MAAPQISGAAALIWGYQPHLEVGEVKSRILNNVDRLGSLRRLVRTEGRLNVHKALPQSLPPPELETLFIYGREDFPQGGVVKPTWHIAQEGLILDSHVNNFVVNVGQHDPNLVRLYLFYATLRAVREHPSCANICDSFDRPLHASATQIEFRLNLERAYEQVEFKIIRAGQEPLEVLVDGQLVGSLTGPGEQRVGTHLVPLGSLAAGVHVIQVRYGPRDPGYNNRDHTIENGFYLDFLSMSAVPMS